MTQILIVEKNGTVKESDVKLNDVNELYKKAGFKTAQGFQLQTTFSINKCSFNVSLYAKTAGRAGQENKYDFPSPVDEKLFFGNCILLGKDVNSDKVIDLGKEQWNQLYEKLFGGFEDLGNEDSEVSEDEIDDDVSQTKEGYVKDGFIVDDSELELEEAEDTEEDDDVDEEEETEEDDEEEDDTEEDEDDMIKKSKKAKKPVKLVIKLPVKPIIEPPEKKIRSKKANIDSVKVKLTKVDSGNYLNCSDELEEEEYN